MVKYTSALLVAAVLAGPALANVSWDDLNARDIPESEVYERDLSEIEAREVEELFVRAPNTVYPDEVQDLAARSLVTDIVDGVFRRGDALVTRDLDELDARDVDELYERYIEARDVQPKQHFDFFRTAWKAIRLWAHRNDKKSKPAPATPKAAPPAPAADPVPASDDSPVDSREVTELDARDFDEALFERDLDFDLEERDLEADLEERDLGADNLLEREYFEPELYDREYLDEEEELMRRDLEEFDDLD